MKAGPLPFAAHRAPVRPEWIDDNGHMNLAYYVLVFDAATDRLCDAAGLDARHRAATRTGVFAVETHLRYLAELLEGDEAEVRSQLVAADAKRLHVAHEMHRGQDLIAQQEVMLLHVNLDTRRVSPFPPAVAAAVQALAASHAGAPRPDWLGRRVAMPSAAPA